MSEATETEMLMYDKSELIAEIVCLQAQLDTESKATSVIADKLKAAIDENVELEDSFQTYFDISTELAADVTNLEAQNKELVEALEHARNGPKWFIETYPDAASCADDEMMEEIDKALSTIDKGESDVSMSDYGSLTPAFPCDKCDSTGWIEGKKKCDCTNAKLLTK